MTREEAIRALERADGYVGIHYINGVEEAYINPHLREAVKVALSALRPVSREQVEKAWRAHWIRCEDAQEGVVKYVCSHCFDYHAFREDFGEYTYNGNHPFCRKCGKAMTDEAVEMVMERLEALNDGKGD